MPAHKRWSTAFGGAGADALDAAQGQMPLIAKPFASGVAPFFTTTKTIELIIRNAVTFTVCASDGMSTRREAGVVKCTDAVFADQFADQVQRHTVAANSATPQPAQG